MSKKILTVLLIAFLVMLSIFPRATEVIAHNYIFGFDQGRDYLAARSIVVDHKLTLIGSEWGAGAAGFTGLFHGPGYYYLLSLAYVLFEGNPYGGVVCMLFLGLLTIILGFFLGKKIFGAGGGYIFAILLAISPPLIAQSRFIWNTYPSSSLIILVFLCIFLGTKTRRKRWFFLGALLSAAIYNFQTGIAIPLSTACVVYSVFLFRKRGLGHYGIIFLGFFVGFLPLFLFEARHHFQGVLGMLHYLLSHKEVTASPFLSILLDHFGTFAYMIGDAFPHTVLPVWLLSFCIFIPLFFFWLREEDGGVRFFLFYLLLIPFIAFFVFLPLRSGVYSYYLQEITFVFLFFFTYVFISAYRVRNPFFLSISSVLLVWFVITGGINAYTTYRRDVVDYGGDAKIKGKMAALDYIYQDSSSKHFNLMIFTPPVYTYPYDYLLQWHGQQRYGFVPGNEKKGELYLLMEVDHAKPWSYKGWLETVIRTGDIEKTITLPSGIIIQRRKIL